ncbi:MAG: ThiF family adenylyltransferase [Methylococcales bacterium]|nr:ThiF family adenylyltransferase [Methylococcales bacterium]
MSTPFDYQRAFSRNLGWVTENEQKLLQSKRIAIAGLGGVGGSHLITLTRLGIGKFNISDLDTFELVNFNRQAGATVSHLGYPKTEIMRDMALDINPDLQINCFSEGIKQSNVDEFLDGVDLYVDGLDFFATEARNIVFTACAENNIPAITAAPLGMGTSVLCFMPRKMTFEEYFCWEGQSEIEQLLRFLVGLTPVGLQMSYLVDDTKLDLANHKGPSTPMGCDLCAGMVGSYTLKILLNRGKVSAVPKGMHFDAYKNKFITTWRPWGNKNPIQKLNLSFLRKKIQKQLDKK